MKYSLAVFDMDGTILNTLEDLKDSLNFALNRAGYRERTLSEVRSFVGNGVRKLVERGMPLGAGADATDKVFAFFSEYYALHSAIKTRPYEGIVELLSALKAASVKLAVVSNKPDAAVRALCDKYFAGLFDAAVGECAGIARKPAPDSVLAVLARLEVEKENAIYIGDSEVDIATAQNSKLDCIAVDWGFRDADFLAARGADIIVSSPEAVRRYILD